MQPRQLHLLTLPRELRDHIYRHYVYTSGGDGYIFDYEARKLRLADNRPIDLGLMYTCRLAAAEMRGLALRLNTITFSTLYSEELRSRAGRWAFLLKLAHGTSSGEVPSVFRDSQCQILEFAASDPVIHDFLIENQPAPPWREDACDPTVYTHLNKEPWRMPTHAQMDSLVTSDKPMPKNFHNPWKHCRQFWETDKGKYRFSAAAAAIHFLGSIPASTRQHIRNLVLDEDHPSSGHPECHAQGLRPFCLENGSLRIERRVRLWETLFLTGQLWRSTVELDIWRARGPKTIWSRGMTKEIAEWMAEAALPTVPEAITLVIDGNPAPEVSSDVFRDVVQADAAWQTAIDRAFPPSRVSPLDFLLKTAVKPYQCKGFPELLKAVCNGDPSSRIRCNFDPGEPWDDGQIDEIIKANPSDDPFELADAWRQARWPVGFKPPPPLPPYYKMLDELLMTEN
ncbi:hypothetical protein B0T24DRAFT_532555 [Lasiosphaeria ovina]|uniref:Uncharacterized protein n=1 Tax=Lasiosphaeria ovina TaxID=92902 RepID=A0AAE0K519_9PEZI|nr:hypothetical protein B0T24DRAFT_532555 [Lasiosphaeria ovina]